MRQSIFYILPFLLSLPTVLTSQYSPFIAPNVPQFPPNNGLISLDLFRRDSKCPNDCSSLNNVACCPKNTNCALDEAGNIGCCPKNAACTGSLGDEPGVAPTGAPAPGSAPTGEKEAAITHAITGSSTVANSYYPYPYLPTMFQNAGDCSSSFSACQAESAKCTGLLEGGGMAVTVSAPGGGVTQAGAMAPATAESVCSSLSVEACHGLSLAECSTLGGSAKTSDGNSFVAGSANAAPTRCAGLYEMGVGMGVVVGLAGQVLG